MRVLMAKGSKQFGAVVRRERGKWWRIDASPYGWIYTLHGQRMTRPVAASLLNMIRVEIAGGKAPETVVERYLPPNAARTQVLQKYQSWLEMKRHEVRAGDRSPRTLAEYERYAREGGELEWWEGQSVHDVTYATLEDWSMWMADRGLGPKSRLNVLQALRAMLGWLERRGTLDRVPEFPAITVPEHEPTIITARTQGLILAAIHEEIRGIYLVLARMGVRPGEARALDVADVVDGEDGPMLTVSKAMKGHAANARVGPTKTKRTRRLPIPDDVYAWLEAHTDWSGRLTGAPLFVHPDKRCRPRWSHWALREGWIRATEAVGVDVGLYEGTKHSFATAARAHAQEDALQAYLGHSDVRSTRRYKRLQAGALLEVIRGKGDK